jgi:hypothetical protein
MIVTMNISRFNMYFDVTEIRIGEIALEKENNLISLQVFGILPEL